MNIEKEIHTDIHQNRWHVMFGDEDLIKIKEIDRLYLVLDILWLKIFFLDSVETSYLITQN